MKMIWKMALVSSLLITTANAAEEVETPSDMEGLATISCRLNVSVGNTAIGTKVDPPVEVSDTIRLDRFELRGVDLVPTSGGGIPTADMVFFDSEGNEQPRFSSQVGYILHHDGRLMWFDSNRGLASGPFWGLLRLGEVSGMFVSRYESNSYQAYLECE